MERGLKLYNSVAARARGTFCACSHSAARSGQQVDPCGAQNAEFYAVFSLRSVRSTKNSKGLRPVKQSILRSVAAATLNDGQPGKDGNRVKLATNRRRASRHAACICAGD